MGTSQIAIKTSVYDELTSMKNEKQSYTELIKEMIDFCKNKGMRKGE